MTCPGSGHVTCRGGPRSSIWTAEVAFPKKLIRRIEKQTVPEIVQTLLSGCHLVFCGLNVFWSRSAVAPVMSVLGCHGNDVLVTAHLLQNGGQAVQVPVGKVLSFPQVQDHAGRTRLGGEVVQIPAREHTHTHTHWSSVGGRLICVC